MKRLFSITLLVLALTGCAAARNATLTARDISGLPSLQEILPGVYAGDWGDARRLDALQERNIKYILNVAAEINDPDWSSRGIVQAKAYIRDCDDPDNETATLAAMDWLDRWYEEPTEWQFEHRLRWTILVHCWGGRNRTLYVLSRWYARRSRMGRNWLDMVKQIQQVRPEMSLHTWMLKQMGDKPW